jgi:hypothetical protein
MFMQFTAPSASGDDTDHTKAGDSIRSEPYPETPTKS